MWPIYFVWKSTRAHGFYGAGLVFGLWALLSALRLRERPTRLDLASLGLALGLGWWATPQIAILGLPAVLWLVWHRPALLRSAPLAVVTFGLGGLPWWLYNVRHNWPSLHLGADEQSKFGHLHNLATVTLPTALGLRLPWSLAWLPGTAVGPAVYLGALGGFAWLLVRRPPRLGILLLAALTFPVLYVASPYTWLITEPRYLTLVSPVIVLLVASTAVSPLRAGLVFAVAFALSLGGMTRMVQGDLSASHAESVTLPASFGALVQTLERNGVSRVWATYWIAYRITFESGERVIAAQPVSSTYAVRGGRLVPMGGQSAQPGENGRYARYELDVARSHDASFVFAAGEPSASDAKPALERARYRLVKTGVFDVWVPPRG
jgi:hypothetical protein